MTFPGNAMWIWGEGGNWQKKFNLQSPFRTCYFRKKFTVAGDGEKLTVHVSADSRYTLYVNGKRVCTGPAKGDIVHQFYDTLVLDDYLQAGENILSGVVICFSTTYPNYNELGVPLSIMTATPAFILSGVLFAGNGTEILEKLHTDSSWETMIDTAYEHHRSSDALGIVSGLGEDLVYDKFPEGWSLGTDSGYVWQPAIELAKGVTRNDVQDSPLPFRLLPRLIPLMREENMRFKTVYSSENIKAIDLPKCILEGTGLSIGTHCHASFILDAGELTTAYPIILFRQGNNTEVKMTYSEALYKNGQKSVERIEKGGTVEGVHDRFICDGQEHCYEPLHWRTFRYIRIDIITSDKELVILDVYYRFTGYPLDLKATFQSSEQRHKKLWEMTFRTLQLCCHETFEDCPYYEQNQYSGDSQVVSLVMGYMVGDWRLTRQAILMFNWSADYEGITKSRYPNRVPQVIPSWSLLWVVMVYEYWLHTDDLETVKECKNVIRTTLSWFEEYLNDRYLLEKLDYWTVVDWVKEWKAPAGCPPGSKGGETGLITAQYAHCLKLAGILFDKLEKTQLSDHYRSLYEKIAQGINTYCWDENAGLYKDSPQYDIYSELGNAWPIIAGCASEELAVGICRQFNKISSIAKSTLYGRYYVFRALEKGNCYDKFSELLEWWYLMMESDLTTWPEEPWLARSYCHAWSCSPGYEFLAGILGVKPVKSGFREVAIVPRTCGLKWAKGSVPTSNGVISVAWEITQEEVTVELDIPANCTATLDVTGLGIPKAKAPVIEKVKTGKYSFSR